MRRQAILLMLGPLLAACGGDDGPASAPSVIDREVFIEAYVDLRVAAAGRPEYVVTDEDREGIMTRHGIDAESLRRFAEFHGRDVDFMNEVWTEVESRLRSRSESGGDG
jgi:hypothetical protein